MMCDGTVPRSWLKLTGSSEKTMCSPHTPAGLTLFSCNLQFLSSHVYPLIWMKDEEEEEEVLFHLEAVQQPSRKAAFAGVLLWQVPRGRRKACLGDRSRCSSAACTARPCWHFLRGEKCEQIISSKCLFGVKTNKQTKRTNPGVSSPCEGCSLAATERCPRSLARALPWSVPVPDALPGARLRPRAAPGLAARRNRGNRGRTGRAERAEGVGVVRAWDFFGQLSY